MITISEHQRSIICQRLKELRTSKGLTFEKLCTELQAKGLKKININSLKYYEICDEYHAKSDSVKGMRLETLFALSEFYGVSTDYILGRAKEKTTNEDIKIACKVTGLSEKSIYNISNISSNIPTDLDSSDMQLLINILFESKLFSQLLFEIKFSIEDYQQNITKNKLPPNEDLYNKVNSMLSNSPYIVANSFYLSAATEYLSAKTFSILFTYILKTYIKELKSNGQHNKEEK